ncbi:MAG TPA: hypothetical protein PK402_12185 [Tepidisphaeraceae bacterium]|nr:hypothetical protein [Tepidisphaeraceae bacterium]
MNPPDVWVKVGRSLVATRSICGVKWTKDSLYVLFPGQQFMQLFGDEATRLWASLAGLAIDLDTGETIPRVDESSTTISQAER